MAAMEVGVITMLQEANDPFTYVGEFGLKTCQLVNWNPKLWDLKRADALKEISKTSGVSVAAVWAGYSGPAVWNFIEGPGTLGLVPTRWRRKRIEELKAAADFAARLGAPAIVTHLGFIPENPADRLYAPTVKAVADIAKHCKRKGIGFWFETGQETPVAMLRLIEDVDTGNLGVNLDPANLILYGKANPVDALDVFGKYVYNVHAKDGLYPTNGRNLGTEVPVGKGKVGFPKLLAGLDALGYTGELIIEREIHGDEQTRDIRKTVTYLRGQVRRLEAKK